MFEPQAAIGYPTHPFGLAQRRRRRLRLAALLMRRGRTTVGPPLEMSRYQPAVPQ